MKSQTTTQITAQRKMKTTTKATTRAGAIAVFALTSLTTAMMSLGCTRSQHAYNPARPTVLEVKSTVVSGPTAATLHLEALKAKHRGLSPETLSKEITQLPSGSTTNGAAMSGEVTLAKKEILDRQFLFGADVQYSSISDEGGMFAQSTSSGHVIAKFQILGDRLQVFSDESSNFQSDINHPGKLIQQYPILRQDADTVTITVREASFAAVDMAAATDSPVRNTWVRSIEYVPQGNYLLVETSVQFNNGKVVEFMESLFPRDTLVAPDAKPMLAEAVREPNAARYRLLGNGDVWLTLPEGRVKTAVVERYPVDSTRMIEWYVTSNIPAEYLPIIKMAVEGWNRYSQKMWHRDLMRFVGIVPAGVKLGDPRYNIINWDSVPDAGSAYESQAVDPLTGTISHSMIYLPYAWIKIGKEYWTNGALDHSDHSLEASTVASRAIQTMHFMGRALSIACEFDMDFNASLEARKSPTVFAYELTKQTLFHEVGHSLGFDHNFKGSLSFDPTKPASMFATSIMDYNQYDVENAAFDNVNSSNGPLLEYDRQVMSVLYNKAADVTANDPVLPACNDSEADSVAAGVDPFCLRYDAGHDPSVQLTSTFKLVHDASSKLGHIQSLPVSIEATLTTLPAPETVTTQQAAVDAIKAYAGQLQGSIVFYFSSGAQSLGSMTKMQIKSLYTYKNDAFPEDAKAVEVRERVAAALTEMVNLESLDPVVSDGLKKSSSDAQAWLAKTAWAQQAQTTPTLINYAALVKPVEELQGRLESVTLPKLRGTLLGSIKRIATSPFAYSGADKYDYEQTAVELLRTSLTQPLKSGKMRSLDERTLALKALLTFKDTEVGPPAIDAAQKQAEGELKNAQTAADREALRAYLKLF